MRFLFVCVFLSAMGARAAADCDAKAKPIYTREEKPLAPPKAGATARTQSFAILASGAWTRVTDRAVGGGATKTDRETGCLAAPRLKLLQGAIAKATFVLNPKGKHCMVAPYAHVVYAAPGRKLSVEHDEPCGPPFDQATGYLLACADAVIDPASTDDYATRMCTSQ